MHSAESSPPARSRAASPRRWLFPSVITLAAIIALTAWIISAIRHRRLASEDKSIATYQIRAALDQYCMENPTRLFVRYEDLIGPMCYVKQVISIAGEDYRELFPLRRSTGEFAITMGDGRRVIVTEVAVVRQRPNGEFSLRDNTPETLKAYQQWREQQRRPDGPRVMVRPNEFRLETTCRDGLPDGPFRYFFFPNGKLWGEGTYDQGRVVGSYREFDPAGRLVYEASFRPFKR